MSGLLEELLEQQRETNRRLEALAADNRLTQEWLTAAECARMKGISQAFLTVNRWARPLGGAGARRIAGRPRWHRSAVREWLEQDDETLQKLYGGGIPASCPPSSKGRRTA